MINHGNCQRIGIERDNLIALHNVNMPPGLLQDYFLTAFGQAAARDTNRDIIVKPRIEIFQIFILGNNKLSKSDGGSFYENFGALFNTLLSGQFKSAYGIVNFKYPGIMENGLTWGSKLIN